MKSVWKILKWIFLIFFIIIVIDGLASMIGGDKGAPYVILFSVICILLILFLSAKKKSPEQQKKSARQKEQPKYWREKSFDIDGFNINNLKGCFLFNEEFDYPISRIKENFLEDTQIYKFEFDLKPVFTRSETGAIRIMANDRVIGDLSEETAAEMKELINSHEGCKPKLKITGGEFKMYDSEARHLEHGRDPWKAELLVSYYG